MNAERLSFLSLPLAAACTLLMLYAAARLSTMPPMTPPTVPATASTRPDATVSIDAPPPIASDGGRQRN